MTSYQNSVKRFTPALFYQISIVHTAADIVTVISYYPSETFYLQLDVEGAFSTQPHQIQCIIKLKTTYTSVFLLLFYFYYHFID